MAATDRSGFGFLPANAGEPANAWDQKAKTQANPRAVRLHRFGPGSRVDSCGISSRVETINPRRTRVTQLTTRGSCEYHYCSINTERRNSENCWSICGNPVPSIFTHLHTPLIIKHLGLFQIGPSRANCVSPA
jgi:hypothetical protein